MSYVDHISVDGVQYDIRDAEAVSFEQEQTLTDAQQEQARANIGAGSEADVSDLKSHFKYIENGHYQFFDDDYVNGTWSNGNLVTWVEYRIALKTPYTTERDIVIEVADGFEFAFHLYENGSYKRDLGYHVTPYSVAAGTQFVIFIRRLMENTSEVADIHEFASKVTWNTIAETALETANTALETANPALETAESALEKANTALEAAEVSIYNDLTRENKAYIRYSDGTIVGSGAYLNVYTINNNGYRRLRVALYAKDTFSAAIAFYSGDTVSASTYMASYSLPTKVGENIYEADVPTGCMLIGFTHRTDYAEGVNGYFDVWANVSDVLYANLDNFKQINERTSKTENNTYLSIFRQLKPCYDHLFVSSSKNNIVIPHESLYHVRMSARMGFNMIEANIAKTSDNVYIVNHLLGGKFGHFFHAADGVTDISDIAVSSVTWDWIVANVRYNSTLEKYRTRPCRLEEFLFECRQQNLIPFLGSSQDPAVVALADQYVGKGNYVAYSGNRTTCPNAILYHWVSQLSTPEDILAYCEQYGRPFIYGMSNASLVSEEVLSEIISTLHENGYWIGTSYTDPYWYKYAGYGMDFNGTQTLINRIENGNLHNLTTVFGYSSFVYTNATEANGVLTFSANGSIRPNIEEKNYDLCGIDLELWFIGTVTLAAIGEKTAQTYTSDGSYPVIVSVPILNGSPKFTLTCASGTVVKDIKYKASIF